MIIIGIDLGTTNSLVSYFTEEGPVIIPNVFGENLTPSIVSVDYTGNVLIGKIAKERLITHPELTASVFKRHMGTKKLFKLGGKEFLPEELSALIIKSLKQDAEHFLGIQITEAVICIPAYFSDLQRKATKRAGVLAGLRVDRLITEPTAAAIAYGIYQKNTDTKFLVFDLGGGTFDVSILELFENIMEVRAVAGDNYLGGEDFTDLLVEYFLKHNSLKLDELNNMEYSSLRKQAEIAKCSFLYNKEITISCLINGLVTSITMTLDEYKTLTKPLVDRLRAPIERALNDASLELKNIDSILLVGGATKLPIIRSFVSKLLGKLAFVNINPDEVVALGAGIQAALKGDSAYIKEVILTDVCSYTLGTSVCVKKSLGYFESGYFLPIIERNTTIPVSKAQRLYTTYDNQSTINVDILQGEARLSKDNIFLGELNITVPQKPGGEEAIDVRFTYDINGILEVEVIVVSTGLKRSLIIEKDPGYMSKEEISKRIDELSYLKMHPRDQQINKFIIAKGERLFEENIGDSRYEVGNLLREFEDVLETQDAKLISKARERLTDILNSFDTRRN